MKTLIILSNIIKIKTTNNINDINLKTFIFMTNIILLRFLFNKFIKKLKLFANYLFNLNS